MKTLITLVEWVVAKKYASFTSKCKFVLIIRSNVGITRPVKHLHCHIIGDLIKKHLKRRLIIEDRCGKSINEIYGSVKGIPLKLQRKMSLIEEGYLSFNYMPIFSFYFPILVMYIRTWIPEVNPLFWEIKCKWPKLTPPICL